MADANAPPRITRRVLAYLGVLGGALLAATATAVGTGLGSRLLGVFDSNPAPKALISSSATEQISECGTQIFIRSPQAERIVSNRLSPGRDWPAFYRAHDAVVVGESQPVVSIQGESARPITLTGIDFNVVRKQRAPGAAFSLPCGGPGQGRFLAVDLDQDPPRIIASSEDPTATADPSMASSKPIKFPWLVSVTDPLLLTIVAVTERCHCIWRASITWRSGSRSGELPIDNGGKGYAVVGKNRLRQYSWSGSKWIKLPSP
jgi:hypothetical protein